MKVLFATTNLAKVRKYKEKNLKSKTSSESIRTAPTAESADAE